MSGSDRHCTSTSHSPLARVQSRNAAVANSPFGEILDVDFTP